MVMKGRCDNADTQIDHDALDEYHPRSRPLRRRSDRTAEAGYEGGRQGAPPYLPRFDYEKWDFYRGLDGKPISGRGKKFEVMVWKPELKPGERITSEAVRSHLRELGFHGHTGAFTAWRKTCGLSGYHASIPEDNDCWRSSCGCLYVPYSGFADDIRKLSHSWFDSGWGGGWSFVAFREIS